MKIVIDIQEEIYQKIKETNMVISGRRNGKCIDYILFNATANGTPLPKGHGRLIDADELLKAIDTWDKFGVDTNQKIVHFKDCYVCYVHYEDIVKSVSGAETIISADKTESEEENDSKHSNSVKAW